MRYVIALAVALAMSTVASADTYGVVLAGKKCQEGWSQQIDCVFTIGKDLRIDIAGIGSDATSATFARSNWEGDYYAALGILHGCIIVKPGLKVRDRATLGFAFISPRSAKVFRDWRECRDLP